MGVRVKEWKGAWWVFINHAGRRRAKRCATKKAAQLAADKIDASLKVGQAGVLDAKPARVPTSPSTPRRGCRRWRSGSGRPPPRTTGRACACASCRTLAPFPSPR